MHRPRRLNLIGLLTQPFIAQRSAGAGKPPNDAARRQSRQFLIIAGALVAITLRLRLGWEDGPAALACLQDLAEVATVASLHPLRTYPAFLRCT